MPRAKEFNEYRDNSPENSFYNELLEAFDTVINSIKKNDSSPIVNAYDPSNKPNDQKYSTLGNYCANQLAGLSDSSTSTQSHGPEGMGGGIDIILAEYENSSKSFVRGH